MCFIKVLKKNDEEVLDQEQSIHDDEYKLLSQCLKKQRKERIALVVLNEKLNDMRQKMKLGEWRLKIVTSWSLQQSYSDGALEVFASLMITVNI